MARKNVVPGSGNLIGDPHAIYRKNQKLRNKSGKKSFATDIKILDTTRLITAQARLGLRYPLYCRPRSTMPKVKQNKRNSAAKGNSYADAAAKTKAANNVFKMNTDVGQHVLKNPGIAQAIVDKADLKQSDVRLMDQHT